MFDTPEQSSLSNRAAWVFLAVVIAGTALLRCQYLQVPLERDEGEYAYGGQLLLQGVPPFRLAYNMKLPGTQAVYALSMALFGHTIPGVRTGLLLANAATILLVFCFGRHILSPPASVVAAAVFAILSVGTSSLGPFGHATHFVLLPALGGLALLHRALASGRRRAFFGAGTCLGLAVLMKQPGAVFAIFALGWWGWSRFTRKKPGEAGLWNEGAALLAGILLPGTATAAWLAWAGVFNRFWFWVVSYACTYGAQVSLADGWVSLYNTLASQWAQAPFAWGLAGLGLVESRTRAPFLLSFFGISFLGVCPGLYFREHYFILMLPAVGLLAGLAVDCVNHRFLNPSSITTAALLTVLAVVFAQPIYAQRDLIFGQDSFATARQIFKTNPFPESIPIARYINGHSAPGDSVAVFGSEPQIPFYAQRRSATGYIYMYSLMENQPFARAMQEEMAHEVEQARPAFIVYVDVSTSWLRGPASEGWIFGWMRKYLEENYEMVGQDEVLGPEANQHPLQAEAVSSQIQCASSLTIFRRVRHG